MGVCDEGRLTDRYGRITTFRSCLIVMTSNLGTQRRKAFGFGDQPPPYADAARTFFRPEFYNRLDAVVTFEPLAPETIRAITLKELAEIERREGLQGCGLRLHWSERLVAWLGREGFDARLGARPLQRVLERRVVAPLARYLLSHPALADDELLIDWEEAGEIRIGPRRETP